MINKNIIAGKESALGNTTIQSSNPNTREQIPTQFSVATKDEVEQASIEATNAWKVYKNTSGKEKAVFLRTIASNIEGLGDTLVQCAMNESGLPEGRIKGERGRTCNQLRFFADIVEEGSWVNATITTAMPDRQPLPRQDIRKMSSALGPVAVFTASNFPLAFSTAGGDTASALASGCPVIVKAHESHLGTNALVSEAITNAVATCGLPKGVFSTVIGGIETGQELVKNDKVKAVGFTGSYKGGKSIFDLANQRQIPIPVYAEMGSNNPIFILNDTIELDHKNLASTIANSVNLGAGQFCTNPGLIVVQKNEKSTLFLDELAEAFSSLNSTTMLNENIYKGYNQGVANCMKEDGVSVLYKDDVTGDVLKGHPAVAKVSSQDFIKNKNLQEEVFGPFTLAVVCDSKEEFENVASNLHGQLTATIFGQENEISNSSDLIDIISEKAGRVIFNGVPTGVEVCEAMHHGGPFPSASNSMYTSVGKDAIQRFVRPVAFQNMPESILPNALKSNNPLAIWRSVNGEMKK